MTEVVAQNNIVSRLLMMSPEEILNLREYMLRLMGKSELELYPLWACDAELFTFDELLKAQESDKLEGIPAINSEGVSVIYTPDQISLLIQLRELLTPGSRMQRDYERLCGLNTTEQPAAPSP